MRLKHVYVSNYKNLKDFTLNFNGESFIDIFVGKNGCGKSNLLEALIEIFQHIFSFDRNNTELLFDYIVKYEINGREVMIEWKDEVLEINGRKRKTVGQTPVPENLLVYYSGHNDSVEKLVAQYEANFKKKIKTAGVDESRKIIGIGTKYKELLLSMLLIQGDDCNACKFVKKKLGIQQLGIEVPGSKDRTEPVVKLVLDRPAYAQGNQSSNFDIENNDESDFYWKPEGVTKDFLVKLHGCINSSPGNLTVTTGYLSSEDRYVLYLDISKIRDVFQDITLQELFRQFDNLKTLGMLTEISVPLALEGDINAALNHFSDGQFQSVYIYAITELFKDKECLTLLDEPDAFLHPEWQFDYLDQVVAISKEAAQTNHILMSSHSAVTLIPAVNKYIKYFDIKNGSANCYDLPKRVAIQKLSNNVIKYREDESLLSIINTIQIENKPILFTEGNTDPVILTEAWHQLFTEEIPFIPFYAFSCTYINQLISDQRIHNEMNGLPLFSLFDFDKAYDQWNGLNGEVIMDDPSQGMIKKWEHGEAYAFMLPIPDNADIHKQVYEDLESKRTFKGRSNCAIEHCFYGFDAVESYYQDKPTSGGSQIHFVGDKTNFAKQVIPELPKEAFEVFRPMLQFIKTKCQEITDNMAAA